jgi:hypothetical protein
MKTRTIDLGLLLLIVTVGFMSCEKKPPPDPKETITIRVADSPIMPDPGIGRITWDEMTQDFVTQLDKKTGGVISWSVTIEQVQAMLQAKKENPKVKEFRFMVTEKGVYIYGYEKGNEYPGTIFDTQPPKFDPCPTSCDFMSNLIDP